MRTVVISALLALFGLNASAQVPYISVTNSIVCPGGQVSATLRAPEIPLETTVNENNGNDGVMFDITGVEDGTITGFRGSLDINSNLEVYYRDGSYVGFEGSSAGWTLLASASTVFSGSDVNLQLDIDLEITNGQTIGIYLTTTNAGASLNYNDGSSLGANIGGSPYVNILTGIGLEYPFSTTYTPRAFVGSVIFEPTLTNISWKGSTSTTDEANFTLERSSALTASSTYGGVTTAVSKFITVNEYEVDASATPAVLGWNESSTLSASVSLQSGLGSTTVATNTANGAMFEVLGNTDAEITGFSIYTGGTTDASVEVLYKIDRYDGFEGNSGAWTSLGVTNNLPWQEYSYIALPAPISVLSGSYVSFYITRTDGGVLNYTSGSVEGQPYIWNDHISIIEGIGINYPFGSVFSPRILNAIVHFRAENPTVTSYSWSPGGGSSPSLLVAPNADVTYTATVTAFGCQASGDVSVSMALGLDDETANNLNVFYNKNGNSLELRATEPLAIEQLNLLTINGSLVQTEANVTGTNKSIPVGHLSAGLYVLQVSTGGNVYSQKLVIN